MNAQILDRMRALVGINGSKACPLTLIEANEPRGEGELQKNEFWDKKRKNAISNFLAAK